MVKKPIGGRPTHPGEILREDILPALEKSKVEIAAALGVSRFHLYQVLDEKRAITPGMALRLAKLLGGRARLWLDLQATYDLHKAEAELAGVIKKIPQLHFPAEEPPALADDSGGRQVPADLTRVAVGAEWEARFWADRFGVSVSQIRKAVETAKGNTGVPVGMVARVLGTKAP